MPSRRRGVGQGEPTLDDVAAALSTSVEISTCSTSGAPDVADRVGGDLVARREHDHGRLVVLVTGSWSSTGGRAKAKGERREHRPIGIARAGPHEFGLDLPVLIPYEPAPAQQPVRTPNTKLLKGD